MTPRLCDDYRAHVLASADAGACETRPADVASHLTQCPSCRAWFDAYAAALDVWLAEPDAGLSDAILARTSMADALASELPALAEMDPGPGFTERVLLHTSRKPAISVWRDRWNALVQRPRFAWEVAYVATLCWVLIFGNPVGAWEWGASKVSPGTRTRVGAVVQELQAGLGAWQTRLTPPQEASVAASSGQAGEAPGAIERAWQAGTAWVGQLFAPMIDALTAALTRVAEWFSGPDAPVPSAQPAPGAPAGEPNGARARSPQ